MKRASEISSEYEIKQNPMGRWYIESRSHPMLAWSGSRWVSHQQGMGLVYQISNFETQEEADDYARRRINAERGA